MTTSTKSHKNNANLLSEQVKEILNEKGLSKIFNYQDFQDFKREVKSAFNQAQAIAERFIEYYSEIPSDYNEYIF